MSKQTILALSSSTSHSKHRLATRLSFAAAGFAAACWAPLVPFAKQRLAIGDNVLGLLLLCLGAGSVTAMPATGALVTRFGSKPVILTGSLGVALSLPFLALVHNPLALAAALFCFGASLGALDVAMNLHAVDVERAASAPLMSGFHALFSLGGFAGSGFMTLLLSRHLAPFPSALIAAVVVLLLVSAAAPLLLRTRGAAHDALFVLPRGIVLLFALLAFVSFLIEGALLDWSALLLVTSHIVAAARGGVGYMLFSIAMTIARLTGDRVVSRLGDRRVFLFGGITAVLGFVLLLSSHVALVSFAGFILIGLGAANIVPILFRRTGAQHQMPAGLALAAVSTAGYAGMLIGPAAIGFLAHAFTLRGAFVALTLLFCLVPALNRLVARP